MPSTTMYHVELSRSVRRARAFNLDRAQLEARFLGPWRLGQEIELGDRRWDPHEAELKVLEGRELSGPDFVAGQGWQNAQRGARDVTVDLLAAGPPAASVHVALIADGEPGARAGRMLLDSIGVRCVDWSPDDELPARRPAAALIVCGESRQSPEWLFEAGRAIGTLGERAAVVCCGDGTPPAPLGALSLGRTGETTAPRGLGTPDPLTSAVAARVLPGRA